MSPLRLDTDHHGRGHVRIGSIAYQGSEGELQVVTVLKPAVMMRQRERSGHHPGYVFADRVREVVDRHKHNVVAHTDAAVAPAIAAEFGAPTLSAATLPRHPASSH